MVKDNIKNAGLYENIHPGFRKAFDFLRSATADLKPGNYEVDGDKVYASVQEYDTMPAEQGKPETHRLYIDIQFMLKGEECIGYAPADRLKSASDYQADLDIEFYSGDCSLVRLDESDFMIVFPHDGHMPRIAVSGEPTKVLKCNMKVLV